MKTSIAFVLISLTGLSISCETDTNPVSTNPDRINDQHPMRDSLRAILERHVAGGIPGIQVAVKNKQGWYFTSAGYASVETKKRIEPAMINWYFSLTKIYTASLVMKLSERGTLKLDAPIHQYLPADVVRGIPGQEKITVRMLLNHSSGIVQLTSLPEFLQWQFSNPMHQPTVAERLTMIAGHPLNFEPGTDFSYSNTNYLLLTLILEQVTGLSYGQLLQKEIIAPLALKQTYYDLTLAQQAALPFMNTYADVDNSGKLVNVTDWNAAIGNSSVGYGGIAGSAADAIRFFEAWQTDKVVSPASQQAMKTWIQGKTSTQPDYGLGIEYFSFAPANAQWGHEGDGLGNTTQLMYVPANDTYVFINCLAGRQLPSDYLVKTTEAKKALSAYVARWTATN